MDKFEENLKRVLNRNIHYDVARVASFQKEVVHMYESKLKKVKIITQIFLAIDVVIMVGLIRSFRSAVEPKKLIMLAVVFLVIYESTVLVKLWYWVMNTKLNLMKEIKQLQLQIAEVEKERKSD